MTKTSWYVVYTKPRSELKVVDLLTRKNIKNYCPLYNVETKLNEPKKRSRKPLFTSYVFVCVTEPEIKTVLDTPGIISYLYWLKEPATISEDEIESLVQLLKNYSYVKPEKCEIHLNDKEKIGDCCCTVPEPSSPPKQVRLILPSFGYCIIASTDQETSLENKAY